MPQELKIAVIGAGSTYTPELVEGVLGHEPALPVSELALMDIDQERLGILAALAQRMAHAAGSSLKITHTLDRAEAIAGSSFVVTQIRVGGMQARIQDEKIPLEFDVIGQETTGPGGLSKALRTIPVILDICADIEHLAPDAWLVNFTNPSGVITEAVIKHGRSKVIGLCNGPVGIQKAVAEKLAIPIPDVELDYFGLNHLNWVRGVRAYGEDRTAEAVELMAAAASPEDAEIVRSLGMLPSAYLRYYYRRDDLLRELKSADETRGEAVRRIDDELLETYRDPNLASKPESLSRRGGANYSQAAVSLIADIISDRGARHIVSVPNAGAIDGIAADGVVEVACSVDSDGPRPVGVGPVPATVRGLLLAVKAYEELAVEAAVQGDCKLAIEALFAHPLVPSFRVASELVGRILEAHRQYLPRFHQ